MEKDKNELPIVITQLEELYKNISADFDDLTKAIENVNVNHKALAKGFTEIKKESTQFSKESKVISKNLEKHNEIVKAQDKKSRDFENKLNVLEINLGRQLNESIKDLEKFRSKIKNFKSDINSLKSDLGHYKLQVDEIDDKFRLNQKILWALCIVVFAYLIAEIMMIITS